MKMNRKVLEASASQRSKVEWNKKNIDIQLSGKVLQDLAMIEKLLQKVEPNKVKKMVKQIRNNNTSFHQYMSQARLQTIKSQDLFTFQQKYYRYQSLSNTEKKYKKNSLEGVKIGFQEFRKKLQEFQFSDFVNQINYYTTTFEREAVKLQKLGIPYDGMSLVSVPMSIIRDLQQNELQNGIYSKIDRNLIRKTALIEEAEQKFKKAVKEE